MMMFFFAGGYAELENRKNECKKKNWNVFYWARFFDLNFVRRIDFGWWRDSMIKTI